MKLKKHNLVFSFFLFLPILHFLSVYFLDSKLPVFLATSIYIIYLSPIILLYSFPFWTQVFNGLTSLISIILIFYPLSWLQFIKLNHFPRLKPEATDRNKVRVMGFIYVFICIWSALPEIKQSLYLRPSFYDGGPSEVAWLLAGISVTALYFRLYFLTMIAMLLLFYTGSRAPILAYSAFFIFTLLPIIIKSYSLFKTISVTSVAIISLLIFPLLADRKFRIVDTSSDSGRLESIAIFWNWISQADILTIFIGLGRDNFGSFGDALGGADFGIESVILTDFGAFGLMGLVLWGVLLGAVIFKRDFVGFVLVILCAFTVSQYSFTGFFYFIGSYFFTKSKNTKI